MREVHPEILTIGRKNVKHYHYPQRLSGWHEAACMKASESEETQDSNSCYAIDPTVVFVSIPQQGNHAIPSTLSSTFIVQLGCGNFFSSKGHFESFNINRGPNTIICLKISLFGQPVVQCVNTFATCRIPAFLSLLFCESP